MAPDLLVPAGERQAAVLGPEGPGRSPRTSRRERPLATVADGVVALESDLLQLGHVPRTPPPSPRGWASGGPVTRPRRADSAGE
ncbi:hypothetical protein AB0O28_15035 [Microbispora sp. NPDC088329]|uniref:hypothetical protein n=1 Tax=Microbispora sp. NPDC088329 TaxID=3154869 RepID=UPI0034232D2F